MAGLTKRALLIGINEYPKLGPRYQLTGCVNDVDAMAQVLGGLGFRQPDITRLVDGEATRDAILSALEQLAGQATTDDIVVVHFSGHGSQIRDREGDEADDWDETIVPYDSGRRPLQNRDITDDEIHDWLTKLTARTRNVTLIFDSCHSGTITRDLFGARARWVERDDRPPSELPPSPIQRRATRGGRRGLGPSGWLPRAPA
jgi:uncharacterized caspase-like protein